MASVPKGKEIDKVVDKTKRTELMVKAEDGDYTGVKKLIKKGANIHLKGPAKRDALQLCVWKNHVDIAALLVKNGADTNSKDSLGVTPLIHAVELGFAEMTKLLLDKGADIHYKLKLGGTTNTVLFFAAFKGQAETAKLLIEYGADVNEVLEDSDGFTPLICAARLGFVDVVKVLIEGGADVNFQMEPKDIWWEEIGMWCPPRYNPYDGQTALMKAARFGHVEIARMLVENGAKLELRDNQGYTALFASIGFSLEITKLLIAAGANVNVACNGLFNPLMAAVKYCDYKLVPDLVGEPDKRQSVKEYNLDFVKVLLEAGALDQYIYNNDILLTYALKKKKYDIVDMLIRLNEDRHTSCVYKLFLRVNEKLESSNPAAEREFEAVWPEPYQRNKGGRCGCGEWHSDSDLDTEEEADEDRWEYPKSHRF